MKNTIIGTICPNEVGAEINRDIIDVIAKKKLLINSGLSPDLKLSALKNYNNLIVELEHDLSTLYN